MRNTISYRPHVRPSVRPSVCLSVWFSVAGTALNRRNLAFYNLHRRV